MTAQRKPDLPGTLREEMARLVRSGLTILPLGGEDGKSPLLRKWATSPPPLGQCLAVMTGAASLAFGIRLDKLLVLDLDTDDPALVARLEARFGPSPVHVKTPRGRHLYYAAGGFIPALKAEGLPVDVKTGPRAYVVAPLSQRPDGGRYAYAKGRLGVDRLPPLRALAGGAGGPSAAPAAVGERHNRLVKEARAMVELVDSEAELAGNLLAFRDDLPEPETMPDSEVQDVSRWMWQARLENRLYGDRNSAVKIFRRSLDALQGNSDAMALYLVLTANHGHIPGKRFCLDWQAMKSAGLIDLSRRRFLMARKALEASGLLLIADRHRAGIRSRSYMLGRPAMGTRHPPSVAPLPKSPNHKKQGEGLYLHMATGFGRKHRGKLNE